MPSLKKPDFICIGRSKTGTTWLYHMLGEHPEVWMPPLKELRYFNEGGEVPPHNLFQVLFGSHWHYANLREKLKLNLKASNLRNYLHYDPYENPWWLYRYSFGQHSNAWYNNLFLPDARVISGDITPNYYNLPGQKILDMAEFNKNLKILLFIRNPIDWAWSFSVMVLCQHRGKTVSEISRAKFVAFFDLIFKRHRSYLASIKLWKSYFPNVFIGYYDTLKENPQEHMDTICGFLEINKLSLPAAKVGEKVNRGPGYPLPEILAAYLKRQYRDRILALGDYTGSKYPQIWLDQWYGKQDHIPQGSQ